jgi:hypothetical protein
MRVADRGSIDKRQGLWALEMLSDHAIWTCLAYSG